MKSAGQKLLSTTEKGHSALKKKFALNPEEAAREGAYIKTDELSPNPITGLYLVLAKQLWPQFPISMKFVWISSVLVSAGLQWATALFLYIYFSPNGVFNSSNSDTTNDTTTADTTTSDSSSSSSDSNTALLTAILSCALLFIYVLGQVRRALLTLRHYWVILEFTFFQYWIFSVLISDVLLHLAVAALSVIAILQQDNISDQLGISLSFFFVLELDEWMYDVFIKDFDVLENEDFIVKVVDTIRAENKEEFWHKKAKAGIAWGCVLIALTIYVVIYDSLSS